MGSIPTLSNRHYIFVYFISHCQFHLGIPGMIHCDMADCACRLLQYQAVFCLLPAGAMDPLTPRYETALNQTFFAGSGICSKTFVLCL